MSPCIVPAEVQFPSFSGKRGQPFHHFWVHQPLPGRSRAWLLYSTFRGQRRHLREASLQATRASFPWNEYNRRHKGSFRVRAPQRAATGRDEHDGPDAVVFARRPASPPQGRSPARAELHRPPPPPLQRSPRPPRGLRPPTPAPPAAWSESESRVWPRPARCGWREQQRKLVRLRAGRLRRPRSGSRLPTRTSFGVPGVVRLRQPPGLEMWALGICWVLLGTLSAGSTQLLFQKITEAVISNCNLTSVILPCIVTNLQKNNSREMFVKWSIEGKEFFSFNGYLQPALPKKNSTFQSAELADQSKLASGIASLRISRQEAVLGNYSCDVTESNREGVIIVELKQTAETWFEPVENVLIILTMVLANIFYWTQLGVVATKYDISFLKKIILITAGLLVTLATVIGCILLVQEGFAASNQVGLCLIVLPAVILVPLLYILLDSVFEKLPYFVVLLLILKGLGYAVAVTGFTLSVSACPPRQGPVLVAGLAVIDLVAVIALVYVIVIGSNFKDHQPPRHLVQIN